MKLKFIPSRSDTRLIASVHGDVITLNGQALDLSPIPEGSILPLSAIKNEWIASDIERIDGELHLSIRIPHGANAPYETRFPNNLSAPMSVVLGPIPIPKYEVES